MITALSFFHLSGIAVTSNSFQFITQTGCCDKAYRDK
jgi:hypothetical protein